MSKQGVDLLGDRLSTDPKDVHFTMRLSKIELDEFKNACDQNKLGMSAVMRVFMKQYSKNPMKAFRVADIYKE